MRERLVALERESSEGDASAIIALLKELVPTDQPNGTAGATRVCAADGPGHGGPARSQLASLIPLMIACRYLAKG